MATNIRSIIKRLPKKEQEAIEARAQVLIKDEMNLQELRKAQQLTQPELAKKLGVKQAEISRLENRNDIRLSSLNAWVEAMGGTLEIAAKIAGKKIILGQFGSKVPVSSARASKRKVAAAATKTAHSKKSKALAHRISRTK